MKRIGKILGFFFLVQILFFSCRASIMTSDGSLTNIHFTLPSLVLNESASTRAVLSTSGGTITIFGSDFDTFTKDFSLSNDSYEVNVNVPLGTDITFSVEATDATGAVYLTGDTTVDVLDANSDVTITLKPLEIAVPTTIPLDDDDDIISATFSVAGKVVTSAFTASYPGIYTASGSANVAYAICNVNGESIATNSSDSWYMATDDTVYILYMASDVTDATFTVSNTPLQILGSLDGFEEHDCTRDNDGNYNYTFDGLFATDYQFSVKCADSYYFPKNDTAIDFDLNTAFTESEDENKAAFTAKYDSYTITVDMSDITSPLVEVTAASDKLAEEVTNDLLAKSMTLSGTQFAETSNDASISGDYDSATGIVTFTVKAIDKDGTFSIACGELDSTPLNFGSFKGPREPDGAINITKLVYAESTINNVPMKNTVYTIAIALNAAAKANSLERYATTITLTKMGTEEWGSESETPW